MRGGEGSAVADDDFARNRLKRGTEVLHGFDHQKAQGGRLNAEGTDLHQIEHLAGLGDDQNINALHAENGGGAEAVGDAAKDGAISGVAAIGEVDDLACQMKWAAAKAGVLFAAQRKS